MKKIEVKFPEIDGMRVNGATLDFNKGCSIVEYVEDVKFKKGDIVYHDTGVNEWVFIYTNTRNGDYNGLSCVHPITGEYYPLYNNEVEVYSRLATDSEKQLLFNALEKEGKYWDAEALEVKAFERVPENIGIYCCDRPTLYDKGDGLYIGFNDNKQNLSTSNGIYTVNLNDDNIYSRTRCYLKPISHEDVKVGDTILCGDKEHLSSYFKVAGSACAYTSDENDIYTLDRFGLMDKLLKLIPIK